MLSAQHLAGLVGSGLCVGSGVYVAVDPELRLVRNPSGEFMYEGLDADYAGPVEDLLRLSAFGGVAPPEDEIARVRFGSQPDVLFDPVGGYYLEASAGWVNDETRAVSSSGGMTTWLLVRMLREGHIDGVVHFRPGGPRGELFSYQISRTEDEIRSGAKSRYYPGELSGALDEVRRVPGRYAIVAIPSIAYEVRLLQEIDPLFRDRIVCIVGLICGHQKTANYAEYLGWRAGVEPGRLLSIDFRKKLADEPANSYSTEFFDSTVGSSEPVVRRQNELPGTDWGLGFFKSAFSDFTEDILNETADVVLGDAWLPQYTSDSRGTNVCVVRNAEIQQIIARGRQDGSLHLDPLHMSDVLRSQGALVRQNVEELPYRVTSLERHIAVPLRVRRPGGKKLAWARQNVQKRRRLSSRASHDAYLRAKDAGDLAVFDSIMQPLTNGYTRAQRVVRLSAELRSDPLALPRIVRRRFAR